MNSAIDCTTHTLTSKAHIILHIYLFVIIFSKPKKKEKAFSKNVLSYYIGKKYTSSLFARSQPKSEEKTCKFCGKCCALGPTVLDFHQTKYFPFLLLSSNVVVVVIALSTHFFVVYSLTHCMSFCLVYV
jgi:hypothetical protein